MRTFQNSLRRATGYRPFRFDLLQKISGSSLSAWRKLNAHLLMTVNAIARTNFFTACWRAVSKKSIPHVFGMLTERVTQARKMLFESFDEDVHGRLKLHKKQAEERKDEMLDAFWLLTKYVLIEKFSDQSLGEYHFDDRLRMFGTLKDEIEQLANWHERKVNCSFAYRLVGFDTQDIFSKKHSTIFL